jgi:hypothetical protein
VSSCPLPHGPGLWLAAIISGPWRLRLPGVLVIRNQGAGEDKLATIFCGLLALVDGDRAATTLSGARGKVGGPAPGRLPVQMAYLSVIVSMHFADCCHLVHYRHQGPILTHVAKKATACLVPAGGGGGASPTSCAMPGAHEDHAIWRVRMGHLGD